MNSPSFTELSDSDLLQQVANGSESAFGELYDRYSKAIYNYLLRLIFEHTVAEDLLQETFLVAWQKAVAFRNDSRVSTWLFSIAHYRAIDWLRHQKVRHRYQEDVGRFLTVDVESHFSFDDVVHQGLQNEKIWRALDRLSLEHRSVLQLAFVYDMSYQEIATVMNCPLGTVKSRMNHALKSLAHHLKVSGLEG
jgi:RNA polymerase sigma-70 factor (ECF subfamily)